MRHRAAILATGVAVAVLTACGGQPAQNPQATQSAPASPGSAAGGTAATQASGCVTDFQPGTDYFPDKATIKHAANLKVSYHDSYQVVTVPEPGPGSPPQQYVLYRCGTPAPELTGELAGAQAISVPIKSLFTGSTTHIPLLDELGAMDTLTGVATGSFITNPTVRQRLADGDLVEYAPAQAINSEMVVAAKPDVLMTDQPGDPAYDVVRQGGVPIVTNAEWLDASPLGRAEWIKFMGALTGREARANEVFDRIEADYTRIAREAADTGEPTRVLLGQMYQGTWAMPGGDSYMAGLIKDANGTFDWSDVRQSGTLMLNLEEVLAKSRDAEVWVMSDHVMTLRDMTATDPRYAEFAAYQSGKVWSNNAKINPDGGNDYWERGVTRPDLVLADLVTVLHPGAAGGHELEFYRQVTP